MTTVTRLPKGVYMTHSRESAILFHHTPDGVWYMSWMTGKITLTHCSDERFKRTFPMMLPDYSLLRAVRKYADSYFERDEQTDKVLRRLKRM